MGPKFKCLLNCTPEQHLGGVDELEDLEEDPHPGAVVVAPTEKSDVKETSLSH